MRIAYVTESFPPDINGVAQTALRVAEHLINRGHAPLIIAPEPAEGLARPDRLLGYPVVRVPSFAIPVYRDLRVGLPGPRLRAAVEEHRADLVHLAGPFVLGAAGCTVARCLRVPAVAVYATDMAAYARTYHTGRPGQAIAWHRLGRIHNAVARTLAPSSAAAEDLRAHGVERVRIWGRGVDTARFDPAKRSAELRARLAPSGEVVARPAAREDGAGQGLGEVRPAGPVAHDDEPHTGQSADPGEEFDVLLGGEPADVADDHLAARR